MHVLARIIVEFDSKNRRTFPWRINRDPYRVFVSEYMLIRTRAAQVVQPFEEFISLYPDISSLGFSKNLRETCEKAFSSLGLLHRAASFFNCLLELHRKGISSDPLELESLPHVGPYIRAAVRVFGYGIRDTIIDANVVRTLARIN